MLLKLGVMSSVPVSNGGRRESASQNCPLTFTHTLNFFKVLVYGCFPCMDVCAPMLVEARKGYQILLELGVTDIVSYHVGAQN